MALEQRPDHDLNRLLERRHQIQMKNAMPKLFNKPAIYTD